jgi:parvulin-like peptidyl-prolyl isomerase
MRRIFFVSLVLAGAFAVQALAEETPPAGDDARRAKVFAKVGSETITIGELEDIINARPPYARKRLGEQRVLRELSDDQVQNELLYQGAEKLGYANDPQVRTFLDQTVGQMFVGKEFEEAVTPDDVPEEEIAKYFKENPEEFRRPEMRRARHILVASKEEAEATLAELDSSEGTTFRALAKRTSLDTETKLRGGDLLYFNEDGTLVGKKGEETAAINPTLAKAAFELPKTGAISKPLDLGDGKWSVLELTSIRPERVQTLEQASRGIRHKLWRAEREGALDKLLADLRAERKPEVYPERADAIVLAPSTEPIEPPNQ